MLRQRAPLDETLERLAARHEEAGPRDRALARAIATVALRRLGTIRLGLKRFLERGLPRNAGLLEAILIGGAAQLLFLDVPDHAAVDLAVRQARADKRAFPYAKLVNAVLRRVAGARAEILAAGEAPRIDTPDWLHRRWAAAYGEVTADAIAAANRHEAAVDISVKDNLPGWAETLGAHLLPTGSLRLPQRVPVPDLPGYAEGAWWVQDAAAALPARLIAPKAGERIIDLCAAPGGKTAQLAAAGASVLAVDRSPERLERLAGNMRRLSLAVETLAADALVLDVPAADAVLLDAPCSATGTLRRHPDVAWTKREEDIASLAQLQTQLLDKAASLVRPGGRLVYCTCSLEPEEGERQVAAFLARHRDFTRLPVAAEEIGGLTQFITADGDLRTLPHALPGAEPRLSGLDGFYAARLVRASS